MLKSMLFNRIFVGCSLTISAIFFTLHPAMISAVDTGISPAPAGASATDGNLQASAIAAKNWLGVVDNGRYDESWNEASALMKLTVSKDEWVRIMNKTRQPLGSVRSRDVVDQRTAFNPKGLPAGSYMVMVYKTSFANKASAYELVTLFQDSGQWRVLTYQID